MSRRCVPPLLKLVPVLATCEWSKWSGLGELIAWQREWCEVPQQAQSRIALPLVVACALPPSCLSPFRSLQFRLIKYKCETS